MKLKKLTALLLAGLMAISMVACGGEAETETDAPAADTNTEAEAETPADDAADAAFLLPAQPPQRVAEPLCLSTAVYGAGILQLLHLPGDPHVLGSMRHGLRLVRTGTPPLSRILKG